MHNLIVQLSKRISELEKWRKDQEEYLSLLSGRLQAIEAKLDEMSDVLSGEDDERTTKI